MDIPIRHVSFQDLIFSGYEITYDEGMKEDASQDTEDEDGCCIVAMDVEVWKDGVRVELEELSDILYQLGLDTKKYGWYTTPRTIHKALSEASPVDTFRFAARERLDRAWAKSGMASDEAFMQSGNLPVYTV